LAVVVCRSAGFVYGLLNIDESDFAVVARMWLQGALPYVSVIDNKPPLTYAVYWLANPWGHFSILPIRLLGVAWVVATCLVLRATVAAWREDAEAGWLAAWCGLFATLCEIPSVNAELLMNLPAAGALYLFVRAQRTGRWWPLFGTGLAVGVAALFKQQAGIMLCGLGLGLLWTAWTANPRRWLRGLGGVATLAGGSVLPWAAVFGVYAWLGHARELVEWVLLQNLYDLGHVAGSPWGRLGVSVAVCVLGNTPLLWWLAARQSARARDGVEVGLAATLWLAWIPVSLGGRFYEHYFLQFAPALAVLAAAGLAEVLRGWGQLARARRVVVVVLLVGPFLGSVGYSFLRGLSGHYASQEPRARAVADWLRSHSRPEDRLFVWGHESPIYFLSDQLPATRFVNASMLIGNYDPGHLPDGIDMRPLVSSRQVRRVVEDLERRPAEWFVDTSPSDIHHWSRVPLSASPELESLVHRQYRLRAEVGRTELWVLSAAVAEAAVPERLGGEARSLRSGGMPAAAALKPGCPANGPRGTLPLTRCRGEAGPPLVGGRRGPGLAPGEPIQSPFLRRGLVSSPSK
jgi:hypothetical protein